MEQSTVLFRETNTAAPAENFMRTESIKVELSDGEMSAYVAYPDKTPADSNL